MPHCGAGGAGVLIMVAKRPRVGPQARKPATTKPASASPLLLSATFKLLYLRSAALLQVQSTPDTPAGVHGVGQEAQQEHSSPQKLIHGLCVCFQRRGEEHLHTGRRSISPHPQIRTQVRRFVPGY